MVSAPPAAVCKKRRLSRYSVLAVISEDLISLALFISIGFPLPRIPSICFLPRLFPLSLWERARVREAQPLDRTLLPSPEPSPGGEEARSLSHDKRHERGEGSSITDP